MKALTVFYDARCGLCAGVKTLLDKEACFVPLHFVPYDSRKACHLFPAIEDFRPGEELLVLSDEGALYRGGDAWIICLWATVRFRAWSLRLARPALRPLAARIGQFVSRYRHDISTLLGAKSDAEVIAALKRERAPEWRTCRMGGEK